MIPDVQREEWRNLIKGKLPVKVSSFSLQMKLDSLIKAYQHGVVGMDEAVKDLHAMCTKYEKIYKNDLDKIFNS